MRWCPGGQLLVEIRFTLNIVCIQGELKVYDLNTSCMPMNLSNIQFI